MYKAATALGEIEKSKRSPWKYITTPIPKHVMPPLFTTDNAHKEGLSNRFACCTNLHLYLGYLWPATVSKRQGMWQLSQLGPSMVSPCHIPFPWYLVAKVFFLLFCPYFCLILNLCGLFLALLNPCGELIFLRFLPKIQFSQLRIKIPAWSNTIHYLLSFSLFCGTIITL